MSTRSAKIRALAVFIGLSVLVHLLVLLSLGRFGDYRFGAPVNLLQAVIVDLEKPRDAAALLANSSSSKGSADDDVAEDVAARGNQGEVKGEVKGEEVGPPAEVVEKGPAETAETGKEKTDIIAPDIEPATLPQPSIPRHLALAPEILSPLRTAGEFLTTKHEKLSYLVSLRGVPVGNVELEAKNENGAVRITLRTRSNAALSSIYPVDDVMETRHIVGNFIITKIRQQEGSFSSDIGFTIFLRDKRVFWIDLKRNRYSNETIPNSEVLDTLSSFYYLRNRPMQIGKTEILHVYDGDIYAPVPIEVLRQEEVRLRNLKKVDTLMLRHVKQKEGIFRRTGDMTIWLTNDEYRTPVKVETSIPLGSVTVELVSSETQLYQNSTQ